MTYHTTTATEARRDPGDRWHNARCTCGWSSEPRSGQHGYVAARRAVVEHSDATGHVGHVAGTEKTSDRLQRRSLCVCGWRGPWWDGQSPTLWHDIDADYAEHRASLRDPHELEVRESPNGKFSRAACSCGWEADDWHPRGLDMTRRHLRTEHLAHTTAVKREEAEATA